MIFISFLWRINISPIDFEIFEMPMITIGGDPNATGPQAWHLPTLLVPADCGLLVHGAVSCTRWDSASELSCRELCNRTDIRLGDQFVLSENSPFFDMMYVNHL